MSAIRSFATRLMNAIARHAPAGDREWAAAMLHELDFIEDDWAALLWALGAAGAIVRRSGRPSWVWCKRQFGFKEEPMNTVQKRAVGLISGVGISIVAIACILVAIHLLGRFIPSADPSRFSLSAWAVFAALTEAAFVGAVIALWKKRRPMAVGILISAILLGTHMAMHAVELGSRQ